MVTMKQIAEVLGCSEERVLARIVGMKIAPVCTRCGGCGEYSFNMMDGSRCYGCGGTGHMRPKGAKQLAGVLVEAKAAVSDGRLNAYLDGIRARSELKRLSSQVLKVWSATKVAQVNGRVGHMIRSETRPGLAELRAANDRMYEAYKHAEQAAYDALRSNSSEDWIKALATVQSAIEEIEAADYDPPCMLTDTA